jgi:hypothetical protein
VALQEVGEAPGAVSQQADGAQQVVQAVQRRREANEGTIARGWRYGQPGVVPKKGSAVAKVHAVDQNAPFLLAVLAVSVYAVRAARLDPATTLRSE